MVTTSSSDLSETDRQYLIVYQQEARRQGHAAWVDVSDAARRCGIGGSGLSTALRLAERGLLARRGEGKFFAITRDGIHFLLPYWRQHLGAVIFVTAAAFAVTVVAIAALS